METLKLTKKYATYPEYKNSGVEWIGKIPKGWELEKLKYVAGINRNTLAETTPADFEMKYIDIGNVDVNGLQSTPEELLFKDAPSRARRIVKDKDTIIATVRTYLKAIAYINNPEPHTVVSTGFAVLNPVEKMFPRFLYYFAISEKFVQDVSRWSTGVSYPAINPTDLGKLPVIIPELGLQQGIAKYLDEKTARIEDIIEKKEKLIELLREKRIGVINQQIYLKAKGSNERLKFSTSINPSKKGTHSFPDTYEVSFVPMEKVSEDGVLTLDEERTIDKVLEGFTYFSDGDVVIAKITPCFENGKGALISGLKNGIGFGTTEFIVLRPTKRIVGRFLYYLTFSDRFRKYGEVEMRGSAGQKRVPEDFVKNFIFTLPSIQEQQKIAKYLDGVTVGIDSAIQKIQKSIELLQEFKSSLISNVVTGKIKI